MKRLLIICSIVVVVLVVGECVARFGLGLGDPPLFIPDQEIDYLFAPNQRCFRFGNEICYNNLSMRMRENVLESDTRRRIFVCGDSIVNGTVLIDQSYLATELLQKAYTNYLICNVSAGSWGPGNLSAYFKENPVIRSNDVVFIVVSSHDLWEDDPKKTAGRRVGHDISVPDQKPFCALAEGFTRYFIPIIRRKLNIAKVNKKVDVLHCANDVKTDAATYNLSQLKFLFEIPSAKIKLIIHRTLEESKNDIVSIGEQAFVKFAQDRGGAALLNATVDDYCDAIHLNESGQRKLSVLLKEELERSVK